MKSGLRTVGLVVAVLWATGMTVALARISGTLDAIAARPPAPAIATAAAPTRLSDVPIAVRAAPDTSRTPPPPAPSWPDPVVVEASPEQKAAHDDADAVLAQIIQKGRLDDDSTQALR